MSERLSREEFLEEIMLIGARRYHDRHPFHIRMHEGSLSVSEFRSWIINRFYYQRKIPVKDAIVLSKLPDRQDRRRWLQRIINHDGRQGDEGGIEAWLKLGQAAGVSPDDMMNEALVYPGVRFAVDGYVDFCRHESWYIAVASSLTELFAPGLIERRIAVVERHYPWIEPQGLQYFRSRLTQAPVDCNHALEVTLSHGLTREDQMQALSALEFKCDVLWSLLDAVDHAGESTDHRKARLSDNPLQAIK